MAGFTDRLATLIQGTHTKPNSRGPGQQEEANPNRYPPRHETRHVGTQSHGDWYLLGEQVDGENIYESQPNRRWIKG